MISMLPAALPSTSTEAVAEPSAAAESNFDDSGSDSDDVVSVTRLLRLLGGATLAVAAASALTGGIIFAAARYHGLGMLSPRKRSDSMYADENATTLIVPAPARSPTVAAIVDKCPSLREGYLGGPYLWGWNGLAQTLYYAAFGRTERDRSDRAATKDAALAPLEWVSLAPQLDAIDANVIPAWELLRGGSSGSHDDCSPPPPVAIIVTGFISTRTSSYVRFCAESLLELGYRAIVLQHSGVDKEIELHAPRIIVGSGTDTRDLHAVVSWLVGKGGAARGAPLAIIGWSMGGNVALKYLIRDHPEMQPHFGAMCVISTFFHPLLMHRLGTETDPSGASGRGRDARLRSGHFTRKMQRMVRRHLASVERTSTLAAELDLDAVFSARTMGAFDAAWTRPMLIESVLHGTRGRAAQLRALRSLGFAVPAEEEEGKDEGKEEAVSFAEASSYWHLRAFYLRASFSPAELAKGLDVPALVVGARDDPFFSGLDALVTAESVELGPEKESAADDDFRLKIPRVWAQLASQKFGTSDVAASRARGVVVCAETDCGGHCSFYESPSNGGSWLTPSAGSWADRAALDFLQSFLSIDREKI